MRSDEDEVDDRQDDAAADDVVADDGAPTHPGAGVDGGPVLTVAAVAARLGVAPATLRTWDRRYGLGPSAHTAGAHRRYGSADVARLMTMRALTLDGVPPVEAARVAREAPADGDALTPLRHLAAVPDLGDPPADGSAPGTGAVVDVVAPLGAPATGAPPQRTPRTRRDDGRPATPTAVIDAALRADGAEVARLLVPDADADLVRWWEDLVVPARAGIASRTVLARPGDEPDALVVAAALAVLRERSGRVPRHPSRRRIVLLLAAPGEPRALSLHVLAGALADAGVDARVVAGPTGRHRLLEIAAMTTPSAVVLASELPAPDLAVVGALADELPDLPVFVMVPDEAAAEVPAGRQVQRVRTVPGLVHEVRAVCG